MLELRERFRFFLHHNEFHLLYYCPPRHLRPRAVSIATIRKSEHKPGILLSANIIPFFFCICYFVFVSPFTHYS